MISDCLSQLYQQQLYEFSLARKNYGDLDKVVYRDITVADFTLRIQYNPARILSTNAKLDKTSLLQRKCFLCDANRPPEQKSLPYGEYYHILVNPYPIFPRHFTIPDKRHLPQRIAGRFSDLLKIARDFPSYTAFYNGPECGASAPDHFHFQMVPRHLMPLEKDCNNEKIRRIISSDDQFSISILSNYLRKVIILHGKGEVLPGLFEKIQSAISRAIPHESETMLNILTWYDHPQWTVCLFPRSKRRPWQFSAEGTDQLLFSPGCVDMAGLIIAPRKEDYEKYSPELLTDLFGQVSVSREAWQQIVHDLKNI